MTPRSVKLQITPCVRSYEQLHRDLEVLREHGAESYTAAICQAVHQAAAETSRFGLEGKNGPAAPQPRRPGAKESGP